MNLHKIIKEEYTSILRENLEYKNIDFNQINDTPQGIAEILNKHIIPNLVFISKKIINLKGNERYDLRSVKHIIKFIENIKEDIDSLDEMTEKYDTNDNDEYFDIIDEPILKANNIYDNLYSLFDQLDTMLIDIDDKFDEFEESTRRYI